MYRAVNRILVIEHADSCPVARIGEWIVDRGATLDVRRGHAGDPVPTTMAEAQADGVVIMGGPQDSWDDDAGPWFAATRSLAADAVRVGAPVLGICLGHQILALALGGSVGRGPATQRGARPITATEAGEKDPVIGALEPDAAMLHWNTDLVLTAPEGATVLATIDLAGAEPGIQAFRQGSALGLQGHPEVTPAIVQQWVDDDVAADRLSASQAAALSAAHGRDDQQLARTGRAIIDAWLATSGGIASK